MKSPIPPKRNEEDGHEELQWREEFESAEDTESQASDKDDVDSMSSEEYFVFPPEVKKNVAWNDKTPAGSPYVDKRSFFERPLSCLELSSTMLALTRST